MSGSFIAATGKEATVEMQVLFDLHWGHGDRLILCRKHLKPKMHLLSLHPLSTIA